MRCVGGVASLLVLSSVLLRCGEASCPSPCLCASDILSCGGRSLETIPAPLPPPTATLDLSHNRLERLEPGGVFGLPRLRVLLLSHNQLRALGGGAFRNASALRVLDLSCNALRVLDGRSLQGLPALQELLLFSNRLARVESHALLPLPALRHAYLSHNRLTSFPFFSLRHAHPGLLTLDLSSNRLRALPLAEVAALPVALRGGLFLHNNTLGCQCGLHRLLRGWEGRGYGSVRHHRDDHTCLPLGEPRAPVRLLGHAPFFHNCSEPAAGEGGGARAGLRAKVGQPLLLHCLTALRGQHLAYLWVSPQQEHLAPPGNGSRQVFGNGTLRMGAVRSEDSGVYLCVARDPGRQQNDTWEVNVTPFNAGFTTLLGCGVSLLLVLMYLFLTPCRCFRHRHARPPAPPPADDDPAPSPALPAREGPGRRLGNSKHVMFLEPIRRVQNGSSPTPPTGPPKHPQQRDHPEPISTDSSAP
ncbi:amphoterin-induced protein 3-like [Anguilla anguilla]|uniref:amphoterin-induced protein 3-like n=1 Tax=Anguilla anguilla TaxID=7936 RepID=UPI0015ACF97E|nr:amphoterin-induced protein 3-like [Anguilla anguilla]